MTGRASPRVNMPARIAPGLARWYRAYARRNKLSLNTVMTLALEQFRAEHLEDNK